jgi:cobalt/nickel transport system ATP-binding protein
MNEPVFELKDVHFSYLGKFPALCGVDLRVRQGEKVCVIGANGTGKSTVLTLLDGLIFPARGSIRAFGTELSEERFADDEFSQSFRSKVGFVFQNPDVQLFCPTVREDIVFGPLQLGVPGDEAKRRLGQLAEMLGITELLDRAPHQLSIGEKRKAAIAAVLAVDPDVILLDEPTAGLDPLTTRHIIDLILEASGRGKTVITATHDLHIIAEIADTVHVFDRTRRIVRSGAPLEVMADNDFLMKSNLVHIHAHRHKGVMHAHPHVHLEHHSGDHEE